MNKLLSTVALIVLLGSLSFIALAQTDCSYSAFLTAETDLNTRIQNAKSVVELQAFQTYAQGALTSSLNAVGRCNNFVQCT